MQTNKIVVGNWKMNLGPAKAQELAEAVRAAAAEAPRTTVWVAPPFVSIPAVAAKLNGSPVKCGGQNVHWEASGAFTGEISVAMLKEAGCSFAITGHSERRHVFGESDELVARRTLGALQQGFHVILCIGETLAEREAGDTNRVLARQLDAVLPQIDQEKTNLLTLAYEPVWAIGTGKVAQEPEIREAHRFTAEHWKQKSGFDCPPVLYGGSVTPDNFGGIVNIPLVAGALVGGASLSVQKFAPLIQIAEQQAR